MRWPGQGHTGSGRLRAGTQAWSTSEPQPGPLCCWPGLWVCQAFWFGSLFAPLSRSLPAPPPSSGPAAARLVWGLPWSLWTTGNVISGPFARIDLQLVSQPSLLTRHQGVSSAAEVHAAPRKPQLPECSQAHPPACLQAAWASMGDIYSLKANKTTTMTTTGSESISASPIFYAIGYV